MRNRTWYDDVDLQKWTNNLSFFDVNGSISISLFWFSYSVYKNCNLLNTLLSKNSPTLPKYVLWEAVCSL